MLHFEVGIFSSDITPLDASSLVESRPKNPLQLFLLGNGGSAVILGVVTIVTLGDRCIEFRYVLFVSCTDAEGRDCG